MGMHNQLHVQSDGRAHTLEACTEIDTLLSISAPSLETRNLIGNLSICMAMRKPAYCVGNQLTKHFPEDLRWPQEKI